MDGRGWGRVGEGALRGEAASLSGGFACLALAGGDGVGVAGESHVPRPEVKSIHCAASGISTLFMKWRGA